MPHIGRHACLFELSCFGGTKACNVAGRDLMALLLQGQMAEGGSTTVSRISCRWRGDTGEINVRNGSAVSPIPSLAALKCDGKQSSNSSQLHVSLWMAVMVTVNAIGRVTLLEISMLDSGLLLVPFVTPTPLPVTVVKRLLKGVMRSAGAQI